MDEEPAVFSIELPPVLAGYVQRQIASGRFVDEADFVRHLIRCDMFDHVGDPMDLSGLVAKKSDRLARAVHPRCALCED